MKLLRVLFVILLSYYYYYLTCFPAHGMEFLKGIYVGMKYLGCRTDVKHIQPYYPTQNRLQKVHTIVCVLTSSKEKYVLKLYVLFYFLTILDSIRHFRICRTEEYWNISRAFNLDSPGEITTFSFICSRVLWVFALLWRTSLRLWTILLCY